MRYQFFQALGLLGVGAGAAQPRCRRAARAAALLIVGGRAVLRQPLRAAPSARRARSGALTPVGGLAWIAGWLLFAWGAWRH